jgi:hypothetical protein
MMPFNCCYSKATWPYQLSPTILFTHKSWSHTWRKTFNADRVIHQDGVYLQVDTTARYPNMTLCHDPMPWVPLTYVCRVGNYVTRSESKDLQVTRFGSRISVCVCVCVCVCMPARTCHPVIPFYGHLASTYRDWKLCTPRSSTQIPPRRYLLSKCDAI